MDSDHDEDQLMDSDADDVQPMMDELRYASLRHTLGLTTNNQTVQAFDDLFQDDVDVLAEIERHNGSRRVGVLMQYFTLSRSPETKTTVFANKFGSFNDLMLQYQEAVVGHSYGGFLEIYDDSLKFKVRRHDGTRGGKFILWRVDQLGSTAKEIIEKIQADLGAEHDSRNQEQDQEQDAYNSKSKEIMASLHQDMPVFFSFLAAMDLILEYFTNSGVADAKFKAKIALQILLVPQFFTRRRAYRLLVSVFAIRENFPEHWDTVTSWMFEGMMDGLELEALVEKLIQRLGIDVELYANGAELRILRYYERDGFDVTNRAIAYTLRDLRAFSDLRARMIECNLCKYYADDLKKDSNTSTPQSEKEFKKMKKAAKALTARFENVKKVLPSIEQNIVLSDSMGKALDALLDAMIIADRLFVHSLME